MSSIEPPAVRPGAPGRRGRLLPLSRPLSAWSCALGWVAATGAFVGFTRLLGGLTTGDAADSVNTTWALAHGAAACAYAPGNQYGLPYSAPLYPLLSAGAAALTRIGRARAFPTSHQLGPHCASAVNAMYHWSLRTGALAPTLRLGYLGWLALMIGVVALLRASGRGRTRWEPVTLLLVAIAPPVAMCLSEYFHPQDLLAIGLVLGALAFVGRGRWGWAGALLGLAFTSQQFAVLALAPLLVVAPRVAWTRFLGAAIGAAAVVIGPLLVLTSGTALRAAVIGSGDSSVTNTLLGDTHLRGVALFALSRLTPVVAMLVVAWRLRATLGARALAPDVLVALVAGAFVLRLVFETNLWGYYFMAPAVLLLVYDALVGRLRILTLVWLGLIALAFLPRTGSATQFVTPAPEWLPLWLWQVVLVTPALILAFAPLVARRRERDVSPRAARS